MVCCVELIAEFTHCNRVEQGVVLHGASIYRFAGTGTGSGTGIGTGTGTGSGSGSGTGIGTGGVFHT